MSQSTKTRKAAATKEYHSDGGEVTGEPTMLDIMKELTRMQNKSDRAKNQHNDRLDSITYPTFNSTSMKAVSEMNEKIAELTVSVARESADKQALAADLETAKMKCTLLEMKVDKIERRLETLDEERRCLNIVIDGIPESDTKHIKPTIGELVQDLGLSFGINDTDSVYRLGAKQPTGKPRSALVKLKTATQKGEIFSNVPKLANNRTWKGLHLNDDLPPNQQAERQDARSIAALGRAKGVACKQRGSSVVIEGKGLLFEATTDCDFGCGLTLAQRDRIRSTGFPPEKNLWGGGDTSAPKARSEQGVWVWVWVPPPENFYFRTPGDAFSEHLRA